MYESSNDISYELQQLSGWLYDGRGGYSLGYLLDKLPSHIDMSGVRCALVLQACIKSENVGLWSIGYEMSGIGNMAAAPKDAAAKLAIALFEQGVLHKGGET